MSTETLRQQRQLVDQIRRSKIFRDYEKAFREMTGLPLALQPANSLGLPHCGDPNESGFCRMLSGSSQACAACLEAQQRVHDHADDESKMQKCFAGLTDSAVPVKIGENLLAYLQTGQVLLKSPTSEQFDAVARTLIRFGFEPQVAEFKEAYFRNRVVQPKQYKAILRLLTIFAQHLSALSNQLAVIEDSRESPPIGRAREYISQHYGEELSLAEVAQQVNMRAFYFCKSFHKATGLTFTDYVARVRVEKVKELLLNPNKRVSEAAYEAGFQSLSQFNRVFRRVAGESPSTYRDKIHGNN